MVAWVITNLVIDVPRAETSGAVGPHRFLAATASFAIHPGENSMKVAARKSSIIWPAVIPR